MDNLNRAAGILVKCGDEVLLCRRSQTETYPGMWSIPSGHLHQNEDARVGAIREFEEETNIKPSKNLKLIGFIPSGKVLMYVYLMEVKEKIYPDLENAKDGHEHDMCGWFKYEDIPAEIGEKIKKVIEISFNL